LGDWARRPPETDALQGNKSVTTVYSTESVLAVEICAKLFGPRRTRKEARDGTLRGPQLGACSACPGDYEDPDRTAWVTGEEEEEDEGASRTDGEEFLAEK
jgi:hypothetical protein